MWYRNRLSYISNTRTGASLMGAGGFSLEQGSWVNQLITYTRDRVMQLMYI
jgi:hypothetical protein